MEWNSALVYSEENNRLWPYVSLYLWSTLIRNILVSAPHYNPIDTDQDFRTYVIGIPIYLLSAPRYQYINTEQDYQTYMLGVPHNLRQSPVERSMAGSRPGSTDLELHILSFNHSLPSQSGIDKFVSYLITALLILGWEFYYLRSGSDASCTFSLLFLSCTIVTQFKRGLSRSKIFILCSCLPIS